MWTSQIQHISNILLEYGYEVLEHTDAVDRVEFEENTVYIDSRKHPESRFYTLLHELGHVIIHEDGVEEFESDHPVYVHAADRRTYRSKAGRVSLIAEEIEAWKRGRWIAREEELYINDVKYDKQMTESVITYINWVAD